MADINNANSGDTAQKKSSGSPWDDELDIPEEPKGQKAPQVIGSLDPQDIQQEEKPVPFNIPEEVIEDKVAKKIPAEEVMGKTKPQYYLPQNDSADANAVKSGLAFKVEEPEAVSADTNLSDQKKLPQPAAKVVSDAPKQGAQTQSSQGKKPLQEVAKPQLAPESIIADKTASPFADRKEAPKTGVDQSKLEPRKISKEAGQNLTPQAEISPKNFEKASSPTTDKVSSESGVSELIKKKEAPVPQAANQVTADQVPLQAESAAPQVARGVQVKEFANNKNGKAMDIKPPFSQPMGQIAQNAVEKPVAATEEAPVISQPSIEKTQEPQPVATGQSGEKLQEKRSLMSRINPFSRRKGRATPAGQLSQSVFKPSPSAAQPEKNTSPAPTAAVKSAPRPGLPKSSGKLVYVFSFLLLLTACCYLTEIGALSIGLEKIYGIVKLEQLWGGLPRGTESALAKAVVAQKGNLSFKFNGKITATVDKSKKSPVTSPLVAAGGPWIALADINVGGATPAELTQYDYYGTDTTDSAENTSDSSDSYDSTTTDGTSDSSSSSSTSTDGSSTDDLTSPTPDDTASSSGYGADQSSVGSYSSDETTVKQLEFEVSGTSADNAIASTIDLKPVVGSSKKIETISSRGNLYVKSSDIKFDDKAASGKWLEYKFSGFSAENTWEDFMNVKFDSGLSATGVRVGNDKLSEGRAYHYKIYNLELGDALAPYGISGSTIDSISGDVWIGIRDHLIKKISLEITPSISSSIAKLNVELSFTEYGQENSITQPALDNIIEISSPSTTASSTGDDTSDGNDGLVDDTAATPATPTPAVTSSTRTAGDTQRNADLESIKDALVQYKSKYGRYPVSKNYLDVNKSGNVLISALVPKYLAAMPQDPNASSGWWYGYKSDGTTFTLSARFENIYDAEVTSVNGVYLHYVRN